MASAQFVSYFVLVAVGALLLQVSRTVPYVSFRIEAIDAADVPQPSPFSGRFQITHAITPANTHKAFQGVLAGPEHVAIAPAGFAHAGESATRVWTAVENGTLYSVQLSGGSMRPETLSEDLYVGPGRPLGFTWDADGGMYICNSLQGLLHWKPGKHMRIIANRVSEDSELRPREPLGLVNSVAVSQRDGKVYFTSSTDVPPPYINGTYLPMKSVQLATMLILKQYVQGRQTGMLLEYDPQTQRVHCLADGLWFANGVALPRDGSFVLFVDSMRMSVQRRWLQGPQAGETEVLLDKLPAFPDNLNWLPETDTFWVGFVARASPALATPALLRSSLFRGIVARLPEALLEKMAKKVAGGIEFDGSGKVLKVVADPTGRHIDSTPSGFVFNGGQSLLMGNLKNDYVAVVSLQQGA